ncbi:MAG: hypothetical protein R3F14_04865 [Polyangiaceae bacterium]
MELAERERWRSSRKPEKGEDLSTSVSTVKDIDENNYGFGEPSIASSSLETPSLATSSARDEGYGA